MIGAANLDYPTLCRTFHDTLANECTSELEKLAEIKQKPFMAPNLDTSWLYKTQKWKWTFGNERMTGKTYQMLKFLTQKIQDVQSSKSDQIFKLHYTIRPQDEAIEGFVYIPNEQTMPEKLDGIDAEMFDTVLLPCLKKTLAKWKITVELSVGKFASLDTFTLEQARFAAPYETVIRKIPTIETVINLHFEDGFTKVNREDKKALQKATAIGVSKASPEQLKVAQIWYRQRGVEVPENIQTALKEAQMK